MKKIIFFFFLIITQSHFTSAQSYKILESNTQRIKVEFNFGSGYQLKDTTIDTHVYQMIKGGGYYFRNPGEPWVPNFSVGIGIPFNSKPNMKIIQVDKIILADKFILPYPEQDPKITKMDINKFDKIIYSSNKPFPEKPALLGSDYIMRYSRVVPLNISPYQYNPVTHQLIVNKKVILEINYNYKNSDRLAVNDYLTNGFLKSGVINYSQAKQWTGKEPANIVYGGSGYGNYWYNPNKNYFKIYLENKGVYRITFDQLVASGVPIQGGVQSDKLELVNEGNSIPIDVVDGGDGIFNSGDYFQFVGGPPSPSPNSRINIYNNSNVYWFSYQSDTLAARYNNIDGYPNNYQTTIQTSLETIHYEKDSLYEPLGHSNTENIDHWYWDRVSGDHGIPTHIFNSYFPSPLNFDIDEHYLKVTANLTGMNSFLCSPDNHVTLFFNNYSMGDLVWDNQTNATFEKTLYISPDSVHLYPDSNFIQIKTVEGSCDSTNECRVNWFDIQYYSYLRTNGNNFSFISAPGLSGVINFWTWNWTEDNMKIYIPEKNKMITNPQIVNDTYKSAFFIDTVFSQSHYYCVSSDYFLNPDSIREDVNSDLRSPSNGADYIIITHPDFMNAAQRLKNLRMAQYPDSEITNPRIEIVDVNQIYDEFSYGLLNPWALQDFVRYAFENWQSPAPAYIVLFGDMSHDYRHILTTSRPNFIPSLPFYADQYGEAPSDNLIVEVAGNDLTPDLAIGRMSCETQEEADILMNKLENYPQDNSKEWKQDVLLASSGLYLEDEMQMHFNEANNRLANLYLIPNGIHPSRVYNFPLNAADSMYMGGGPKIRDEINQGVVIGNYYGHGGGGQWDLIFTNDDIALLQNGGRLPVIFSVTCYTAHFDDQDVFGEKFDKLPGGGSIGFFGNTVLTYWGIGNSIGEKIFNEIFNNRDYVIGKAILDGKSNVPGYGLYGQQITLLTYLGDPGLKLALPDKPDFVVKSSDISLSEVNPLVNDTIKVKVKVKNLGVTFPGDTVNVQVFASSTDTSYIISTNKLPSFGEEDSVIVDWTPTESALYNIKVEVNELEPIPEDDHSDNTATASFAVYNVSEANVLYPQDGYSAIDNTIKFKFIDIGHYINFNLTYYIEIDSSLSFSSPLVASGPITPSNGLLNWISPSLPMGSYFWRVRIYDGTTYGEWSKTRSFSILSSSKPGFYSSDKELKLYDIYNLNYSDSTKSLKLNTSILPPRPNKTTFIGDIFPDSSIIDTVSLTAITTDGTYIYFANMWYYASGKSRIYKIGTGYNGTVKGQYYGPIPNFYNIVANSITYHSDGFIYVTTPDPYHLEKVNPQTGDTSSVLIPDGLLNAETGKPTSGIFYVKSDGQYFYNLTLADSLGNNKYVLRIIDPANGWHLLRPDIETTSSSFEDFSDFFVADGYLYPTEVGYHNLMRSIRISDGYFEDEWEVYTPWQSYYSWCYDWVHDIEVASVFDRHNYGFSPKFSQFEGRHVDANGNFTTQDIGPASNWKTLTYDFHQNLSGTFSNVLYGLNKATKIYDTLATNIPENYNLQNISASDYKYLRLYFKMTDTTFNTSNPMQFKSLNIDYDGLPEIMITKNDLNVFPDSVLQGLNTTMHFNVKNVGFVPANNIALKFYLNDQDSTFFTSTANLMPDSSTSLDHTISTTPLIFDNNIKAIADYPNAEYFTFNNIMTHTFYVARDSTKPIFNITFDGKEIIDGDIVSSKPDIDITLKDNSPLPIDTSDFTVIFDNVPLDFNRNDVHFTYTPYPNSDFDLNWKTATPFTEGRHTLEVLAKDASGNFFDTTSYRINFYVYTQYDLKEVYNYPNPFKDGTYFTFIVTGDKLPDQLYIKIYTVAGRLIKTINISSAEIGTDLGFKRIYWDGKDEDGDSIANGVYFYKMIYKVKDVIKTVTQKLAKVK